MDYNITLHVYNYSMLYIDDNKILVNIYVKYNMYNYNYEQYDKVMFYYHNNY